MSSQRKKAKFNFKDGEYEGEYIGNKVPHGQGTIKYPNGDSYSGEWKLGQCHGKGALISITKEGTSTYKGEMKEDHMHGTGLLTFPNKDVYEGAFVESQFNGAGRYTWNSGPYYQGLWKDNKRHGQGLYVTGDQKYEGGWKNDMRHGKGIETSKTTKLEGFWLDGKKHGTCFIDLKKKSQGFMIQVYENGSLKSENIQDTAPTLIYPEELLTLTDEKEEELLKGEDLDEDEIGFIQLLTEAIINKKSQTWDNLMEAFLSFYLRKLEFEDLISKVSRLEEIKKSTKDKIPIEEKLKDFENAKEKEEMLNMFEKYSIQTDFTLETAKEIVKMKYMVLLTQIRSELNKINNDVDEMNKLGDIDVIRSKEKDLERRYKLTKQVYDDLCSKLSTSDNYKIDKSISAYDDLFKLSSNFITKLLKTKKKYFKALQGVTSKETLTLIEKLFEKNITTFDSIVISNQFSKLKLDLEALNRRCWQFENATREKKI